MAIEIKMPQLSDTMHAGKIIVWKKQKGDKVNRGDILAEVETDKANLEIESFHQGTLLDIKIEAGTNATVGEVIAVIGQAGETVGASSAPVAASTTTTPVVSATPVVSSTNTVNTHVTPVATTSTITSSDDTRIKASPLAKKIAEQNNIDLSRIQGSGPSGRIVKKDLEVGSQNGSSINSNTTSSQTFANTPTPTTTQTTTQSITSNNATGIMTPLSKMRDTIARRMQESVTTHPHFYVTTAIEMDNAIALKDKLKTDEGYKGINLNHLIIKAVAYALEKEPRVNRAIKDGMQYEPPAINVGVITAIEDGLMIPVIKDTNKLHLKDIVLETRAALDRVRAGRPNSSDLLGGTFSISNMGMFDVENFTAIINPGQGGVIAISSTKEVPVVKNKQIIIVNQMKVTLSVDHRVIDGVMGATFLKHFKDAMENPVLMFV